MHTIDDSNDGQVHLNGNGPAIVMTKVARSIEKKASVALEPRVLGRTGGKKP